MTPFDHFIGGLGCGVLLHWGVDSLQRWFRRRYAGRLAELDAIIKAGEREGS